MEVPQAPPTDIPFEQSGRRLSVVFGPSDPPLLETTLGAFIQEQVSRYRNHDAVIVPWQSARRTYQDLADRSKLVAKSLLGAGLKRGDCVAIMAGNCYEYVEIFLGGARIGCPVVVLNTTFSPGELQKAISRVKCKVLFIARNVGSRSLRGHADSLLRSSRQFRHLVFLGKEITREKADRMQAYESFISGDSLTSINEAILEEAEQKVENSDVLNLQFTSGTTGFPKAASLTHRNLLNDGRFVGRAMRLTENDVICCPPPLFHCFGLVMGFLAAFCHGSSIVFPSDSFNPHKTLESVFRLKATALLGVPTMFLAELEALEKTKQQLTTVRTGLIAGAPVSPVVMESIRKKMNIPGMLIAYGMTETSPVTFITSLDDSTDKMFNSIGRVLPHTGAKVIDGNGQPVPVGARGEICTSGFALQKGYWDDDDKTSEVMKQDENGVVWMHTGDEGFVDAEGYGHITGRIKDLIIRGGENISPGEIEDRLLKNPAVGECCVVGLEDKKYGEVVACFLRAAANDSSTRLSDEQVRAWISQKLDRIKEPKYVFWVGDADVGSDIPKTGSGKYQKHLVRALGNSLVKRRMAKL